MREAGEGAGYSVVVAKKKKEGRKLLDEMAARWAQTKRASPAKSANLVYCTVDLSEPISSRLLSSPT
jgi:hypothetical protein